MRRWLMGSQTVATKRTSQKRVRTQTPQPAGEPRVGRTRRHRTTRLATVGPGVEQLLQILDPKSRGLVEGRTARTYLMANGLQQIATERFPEVRALLLIEQGVNERPAGRNLANPCPPEQTCLHRASGFQNPPVAC